MGTFTLDWKGDEVRRHVAEASVIGVEATMEEGVAIARSGHPEFPPASAPDTRYANRTLELMGSTSVKDHAHLRGAKVVGVWGADANYALYVELGTSRKDSGAPRAQIRALRGPELGMWEITYPSPNEHPLMAPRYTLRPAADEAYRGLVRRIRTAYQAVSRG